MSIYQDTVYSATFTVKSGGVAVDITDWEFAASFRSHVQDDDPPLLTLTTANSGFSIVSAVGGQFSMQLTPEQSALLPVGHVVFDIMKTDTGEPQRLCGCRVRVKQPVTRL